MANFVLVYTGGTMPETEEEQSKVMEAWGAWYGQMGDVIVDGGNPFSSSKHIGQDGVGNGPVSSPPATGYTVISAESLDEAVSKCEAHPHVAHGGQVSVYETFTM